MKYRLFIFFILAVHFHVEAKSPPSMEQAFPGMEMGELRGTVWVSDTEGNKKPLSHSEVALVVFHKGEQVLALHKPSDANGEFVFKNIFKDPSFEFAIGVLYEDSPYVMEGLHLEPYQDFLAVDLQVGEGSPYLVPQNIVQEELKTDLNMPPPSSTVKGSFSVSKAWGEPHQKMALFLSAMVVILALYFGLKKKNHPSLVSQNSPRENDLAILSWLREERRKGSVPENVFKIQEEKILERLKKYYT